MSYPVYERVPAGMVLPIMFDTFDGGTGASITMSGLAVTDIEIYKNGSTTQRSSDAGYTLLDTDGIDFDSLTGIHGFSVDTGNNTDSGFYTVGAWFHVVISAITVDGQTLSFIAAAFRIVHAEPEAGVPAVGVDQILANAITATAINADAITNAKIADNAIAAENIASDAITAAKIATDAITAAKIAADAIGASELATDAVTEIVAAVWVAATRTLTAGTNIALAKGTGLTGLNDLSAADVRTALGLGSANLDTQISGLDTLIDSIIAAVITNATGADIAADIIVLKALADTLATAAALATVDGNVDAIKVVTDQLADTLDDQGAGVYGFTTAALQEAPTGGSAPTAAEIVDEWEAQSQADPTGFHVNLMEIGGTAQTANDNGADINAILADTNELQQDWANGGRLDLILDARASQTSVDGVPTNAEFDARTLAAADYATATGVTAVTEDTEDIQARLPAALTGAGNMPADMVAISGDATSADRLEALMDGLVIGQVNDAGATTTAFIADGFTEATDDHYIGRLITFLSGALIGQQTAITDYAGGTQTFTVEALTEAPANDVFFIIH